MTSSRTETASPISSTQRYAAPDTTGGGNASTTTHGQPSMAGELLALQELFAELVNGYGATPNWAEVAAELRSILGVPAA